jgi:flagellar assembly protein FliH
MFVAVDRDDVRVIDSNELLQEKMATWGQANRNLDGYDDEGADGFTSLNPEQVEGEDYIGGGFAEDGEVEEAEAESAAETAIHNMEEHSQHLLQIAEDKLEAARVECDRMFVEAEAKINMMKEAAAEEGHEQGYKEGMEQAALEIEQLKASIHDEKLQLEQEYQQLVDELEPRFIDLLTDIYERVFEVDMKDYAPVVAHLLSNTIRQSDETRDFIVRVSPKEYDYVAAHRDEIKESAAVGQGSFEIIKDQTLAAGACLIETAGGVFDAGFDTQLQGLNAKLRLLSYGS